MVIMSAGSQRRNSGLNVNLTCSEHCFICKTRID